MRYFLGGMLLAGVVALCSGCEVVNQPGGWRLKPIPWTLGNGTYRPFNDVNSEGLPRLGAGSWRNFATYEETIERGQLMRY
jgi:hypothetical protein